MGLIAKSPVTQHMENGYKHRNSERNIWIQLIDILHTPLSSIIQLERFRTKKYLLTLTIQL